MRRSSLEFLIELKVINHGVIRMSISPSVRRFGMEAIVVGLFGGESSHEHTYARVLSRISANRPEAGFGVLVVVFLSVVPGALKWSSAKHTLRRIARGQLNQRN